MCTAPPDCHAACMPPHTHCHGTCTCVCRVANHRPLRATQSVRVKPEQQKIELTFPLDTSSEYYDPVAGRAIATATVDEDGGDDDDDDDGDGRVTLPHRRTRSLALSLSLSPHSHRAFPPNGPSRQVPTLPPLLLVSLFCLPFHTHHSLTHSHVKVQCNSSPLPLTSTRHWLTHGLSFLPLVAGSLTGSPSSHSSLAHSWSPFPPPHIHTSLAHSRILLRPPSPMNPACSRRALRWMLMEGGRCSHPARWTRSRSDRHACP
jgi:hypothetical protein